MRRLGILGTLSLFATLALVAACDGKASSNAKAASADGAAAAFVPACAPAPVAPPGAARTDLREPRLTSLSRRPSSLVDVAAGRPPDAEHSAGTLYAAAVLDSGRGRGEATLFEWDVASASTVDPDGRLLYRESDKVDNGRSAEVRITTTHENVFVAVTLEHGLLTVLGRSPLGHDYGNPEGEYLPPARNISLETDGRWLAVAYERTDHATPSSALPHSGVLLYDALSMKRVASIPFDQARDAHVRYDILEMLDGRLYAAAPAGAKVRVVELAVPSLKVVRQAEVGVANGPDGSARVQLTRTRGHLLALSNHVLVELTPDLEVVGRREIHADEVALGPGAELLTPVGLEAPGRRGDYVADARASASCTPAWVGAYPLLACAVDMDGVRVARLAPR